eukprot:jgi/Pico_ML_1/55788/g1427.t2
MISLVGFADGSGRVLAVKDYRGEVSMERVREFCDNVFRTGDAADMPPLVQLGDVNFVFTKSKEVYAFAASRWDANCSLALEFLEQILEVLKSYSHHDELKADKIREKLTLVLSVLDEAMDFGYPQMLEADILKQYVFEKSIPTDDRKKEKLRERQMRAAAAATGAVPWAAPHTSHGKAKLKLSDGYIRWKIPEMTGGEEYRLTSSVDMVYKARKKHSAQVTAMKFITKKGKCEKDLEGLRQEIEILRNLKHENIVEMLDAFETPTEFCVVTEFAHGELFEVLQHDRRLKEDQRRGK